MAYRILIVDDEAALQNMVKEILTQAGYETASALTCAQALEQFRAAAPDAVLLDVNLPDGDGFSLLGKLRENRDVPVLFLSARDEDADRLQGLGLGADDYITKPFLPQELLLRLHAVLRRVYREEAQTARLGDAEIDWGKAQSAGTRRRPPSPPRSSPCSANCGTPGAISSPSTPCAPHCGTGHWWAMRTPLWSTSAACGRRSRRTPPTRSIC